MNEKAPKMRVGFCPTFLAQSWGNLTKPLDKKAPTEYRCCSCGAVHR
jgi:hypothetical protein